MKKLVCAVVVVGVLASLPAARGRADADLVSAVPAVCRAALFVPPGQNLSLAAVAVVDPQTVYAVGNDDGVSVVERWRAGNWMRLPIPNVGSLEDISATARNKVWALGTHVALHWNGTTWKRVRLPSSKSVGALEPFLSIAATRRGVWGAHSSGGPPDVVGHWNGTRWRLWRTAGPEYDGGISAVTDSDVWVGGSFVFDSDKAFVMHWNGHRWRRFFVPELSFVEDVDALGHNDLWVAGETFVDATGRNAGVVEHWDGTHWHAVHDPAIANPYGADHVTYASVSGLDATTAWVGGYAFLRDATEIPLTIVATPAGALMPSLDTTASAVFDIAAVDRTTAWAVGESDAARYGLIEHVACG